MIRNFLRSAFRNLTRNKTFSFVNILGLAIGIASTLLILLWIKDEIGFDRFHTNTDRIYMMYNRVPNNGSLFAVSQTPNVLATTLKNDFPEVEKVSRFGNVTFLLTSGEKKLNVQGAFVDSSFLSIFSFPLLNKADQSGVLSGGTNIVITRKLARKLFGEEDAIGKVIRIDSTDQFKVTGVLADLPTNTQFDFEYLLPRSYQSKLGWEDFNWTNNFAFTYVLVKPGTSQAAFDSKVKNLIKDHTKGTAVESKAEIFSQPIARAYLYTKSDNGKLVGGRIEKVRLFGIIAIFILLTACINFMNLSTARSYKRAKEVGIRKVVGAGKNSLIFQFIGESILLVLIAFIIAVGIVQLSLPGFNQLASKQLVLDYVNPSYWFYSILLILVTGLVAGSYPAFYLSSFLPVKVLKGTIEKVNALVTTRKVLVVVQFSFAIVLIIATIIVLQQIRFSMNRDAGYNRDGLIFTFNQGDVNKNYQLIKNELLGSGAALSVTKSYNPITRRWSDGSGFQWPGSTQVDEQAAFIQMGSDADFAKTTGVQIIQGRDIDIYHYPTDSSAMLLNETAVKRMHLENPIGKTIKRKNYKEEWHVIGIIKDFILESPYETVNPTMVIGPIYWSQVIHIKLNSQHTISASLATTEKIFKKYNPSYPFEYVFADESYARKFEDEKRTGILSALFAGLSIFISCMGLFGLATYMAENRLKEIGVRKVLGASALKITILLSKDFLKLVSISFLIAAPVAAYIMHQWLEGYSYRVEMGWWIFVSVAVLVLVISFATVSYKAIRAANLNPVKTLRSE